MAAPQKAQEENIVEVEEIEVEVKPIEVNFAEMAQNANFGELISHVSHLYDTNPHSVIGLKALKYFHIKMQDDNYLAFCKGCIENPYLVKNMPEASGGINGKKKWDFNLSTLQVESEYARMQYQILSYRRDISGYKEEPSESPSTITMDALAEVKVKS